MHGRARSPSHRRLQDYKSSARAMSGRDVTPLRAMCVRALCYVLCAVCAVCAVCAPRGPRSRRRHGAHSAHDGAQSVSNQCQPVCLGGTLSRSAHRRGGWQQEALAREAPLLLADASRAARRRPTKAAGRRAGVSRRRSICARGGRACMARVPGARAGGARVCGVCVRGVPDVRAWRRTWSGGREGSRAASAASTAAAAASWASRQAASTAAAAAAASSRPRRSRRSG